MASSRGKWDPILRSSESDSAEIALEEEAEYLSPGEEASSRFPPKSSEHRQKRLTSRGRPTTGWRSWLTDLFEMIGRPGWAPNPSNKELAQRRLDTKIADLWKLTDEVEKVIAAIFNFKGGAGKTPLAAYMACMLAEITGVGVAFADGNPGSVSPGRRMAMYGGNEIPDWAKLPAPLPGMFRKTSTVLELYKTIGSNQVNNAGDLQNQIRQNHHRVNVLVADHQARSAEERLSAKMVNEVFSVVTSHNRFTIVDTGNDYTTPAQQALAKMSTDLVFTAYVKTHGALDDLAYTMDTLRGDGFADKVDHATVVISGIDKGDSLDDFRHYAGNHLGPILGVPFDPVIYENRSVRLDLLHPDTKEALIDVCLSVLKQNQSFARYLSQT